MKIFNSSQLKRADAYTIEHEPVTSLKLMERAAEACAGWLRKNCPQNSVFQVFCGSGNNGGDGLALARILQHEGFKVNVFADPDETTASEDFKINYQRLTDHNVNNLKKAYSFQFDENSVIIDALFGTGLSRAIDGKIAKLIVFLNSLEYRKVSLDLPSGLFVDQCIAENSAVFVADYTLSFQLYKKAFLHPETGYYCGNIHILDIGLHTGFIAEEPTNHFVVDDPLISKIYTKRKVFSHKGTYGKSAIVAGSYGKMGAAVLATQAAIRAGSGITFACAPACGYEILQTACPEAMFSAIGEDCITDFNFSLELTIGIGPGLGTQAKTQKAFLKFLKSNKQPLVLDADALNILALNSEKLKNIPPESIITPHPIEFDRLFGPSANSYGRLDVAVSRAADLKIFIVLKEHHTQIITPAGQVFYNLTGNAGMAKGGSGDVLLGIVTSLLAQNYSPNDAAILGVWLHGKAGDLAAEKFSVEAMLPSDTVAELGNVFLQLKNIR